MNSLLVIIERASYIISQLFLRRLYLTPDQQNTLYYYFYTSVRKIYKTETKEKRIKYIYIHIQDLLKSMMMNSKQVLKLKVNTSNFPGK